MKGALTPFLIIKILNKFTYIHSEIVKVVNIYFYIIWKKTGFKSLTQINLNYNFWENKKKKQFPTENTYR